MAETDFLDLAKRVIPGNIARAHMVAIFLKCWTETAPATGSVLSIGVIGGEREEPEARALQELGVATSVWVIGIDPEESDEVVDLNVPPMDGQVHRTFDVVLCSQVLEHVWNHEAFFRWLAKFTRENGYLWLAAPAANRPHGSPDFYSPGFTSEYLQRNLLNVGLQVTSHGLWGSRRLFYNNLMGEYWPSVRGYSNPLLEFENTPPSTRALSLLQFARPLLMSRLLSARMSSHPRFATEAWAWAKKNSGITSPD